MLKVICQKDLPIPLALLQILKYVKLHEKLLEPKFFVWYYYYPNGNSIGDALASVILSCYRINSAFGCFIPWPLIINPMAYAGQLGQRYFALVTL